MNPIQATLVLLALSAPAACAEPPSSGNGFATDPIWDDGLAEVSVFEASRVVYGADRPHEAVLIVVKEDHDARTWVKADPPYEGREIVPVLKMHFVREIPTPNYPYRYATSVFVRRDDPLRVVKARVTCQEWCGTTFKQLAGGRLVGSGYFDGEGWSERTLDIGAHDLVRDALPLQLRGLPFVEGFTRRVRVLDLLASNRVGGEKVREGTLRVEGAERVACGLGEVLCRRVRLSVDGKDDVFWFDAAPPHGLVRMEAADGRRLLLKKRERRAYWVRKSR